MSGSEAAWRDRHRRHQAEARNQCTRLDWRILLNGTMEEVDVPAWGICDWGGVHV
jgi:hypothetical protein